MADKVESPAVPAVATPKKAAKAQKPRAKASHPPASEMVNAAIATLKERGGSSLQAIKKYIAATYKVDVEKQAPFIRKYLKAAVASKALIQTKGKGAAGSFKLNVAKAEGKAKAKPKTKTAAKPKAAAAPKAKKAASPKKAVAAKTKKAVAEKKKTPKVAAKPPKAKSTTAKPKVTKAAPKKAAKASPKKAAEPKARKPAAKRVAKK
ncbi:histone H1B-like [Leptopilina heterotoma]|uniref:histone H1B-like n=1 Tax=Leptopilina heterotoma TaxID=63436 RepID=UPI001CA98405|nr:histone H1B-like [Leptopilina heterotoma]